MYPRADIDQMYNQLLTTLTSCCRKLSITTNVKPFGWKKLLRQSELDELEQKNLYASNLLQIFDSAPTPDNRQAYLSAKNSYRDLVDQFKYEVSSRLIEDVQSSPRSRFQIWDRVSEMRRSIPTVPIEPRKLLDFFKKIFFRPGTACY